MFHFHPHPVMADVLDFEQMEWDLDTSEEEEEEAGGAGRVEVPMRRRQLRDLNATVTEKGFK